MDLCRVHRSIILVIAASSVMAVTNPVPMAAAQDRQPDECTDSLCHTVICSDNFPCQSFRPDRSSMIDPTACTDSSCHTVICSDKFPCQSFRPTRSPMVEPVPGSNVMGLTGQDVERYRTSR
jgi:hypothetical protein